MNKRKCFCVILGGLLILLLFVNIYFLRVIVESSSPKSELKTLNLVQVKSKSNNNMNLNNSVIQMKFSDMKPSNINIMETKIKTEIKALPVKYLRKKISYTPILNQLLNELKITEDIKDDIWKFPNNYWPSGQYLIPSYAQNLGTVLNAMRKAKILKADNAGVGTQLKLILTFENGLKALFKPQWYTRNSIIQGPVYYGKDRHNAEIVAFHLSSLLGLRRVPLAVIRTLNLHHEVIQHATPELFNTIYQDGNNTCFYGVCHYCSIADPICAAGDLLEGALILWLPSHLKLIKYRHPWQRIYQKNKHAVWETDSNYCEKVQRSKTYAPKLSNRLLDLIDATIFDFLMDNGDRHHYELFQNNFNNSSILLIDNGKSLGNPDIDHYDILAPLYQCCMIHKTTWERLTLFSGGILSQSLNKLLIYESDTAQVLPLITNNHLNAMNRRLLVIYAVVEMCIKQKKEASQVIIDQK